MIDTTIELISLAASNYLMVFCFCNLLIAFLVVGSSKTTSQLNPEKLKVGPTEKFKKISVSSLSEKKQREVSSVSIPMISNEDDGPDDDDDQEEDDDELRKRVEEFIEKINNGWRAEKVKTYS